jgi:hypothetical protein
MNVIVQLLLKPKSVNVYSGYIESHFESPNIRTSSYYIENVYIIAYKHGM